MKMAGAAISSGLPERPKTELSSPSFTSRRHTEGTSHDCLGGHRAENYLAIGSPLRSHLGRKEPGTDAVYPDPHSGNVGAFFKVVSGALTGEVVRLTWRIDGSRPP
jgi:hypothetical protein